MLADAAGGAASTAAAAAPADDGGFFGFLADGFEYFLEVLNRGLEGANVPYSYGFSIILLTLLVKAATFPLSQKSVRPPGVLGGVGVWGCGGWGPRSEVGVGYEGGRSSARRGASVDAAGQGRDLPAQPGVAEQAVEPKHPNGWMGWMVGLAASGGVQGLAGEGLERGGAGLGGWRARRGGQAERVRRAGCGSCEGGVRLEQRARGCGCGAACRCLGCTLPACRKQARGLPAEGGGEFWKAGV